MAEGPTVLMKFKSGDILIQERNGRKPLRRRIVGIFNGAYEWRGIDSHVVYWSGNSEDPLFESWNLEK